MSNDEIALRASNYWTDRIQKPYTYIHNGNIKLKIDRKSIINESKALIFKNILKSNIESFLERSFEFVQIREDNQIILDALDKVNVMIPEGYFKNRCIMYIEDSEIYVYEDGMSRAEKIRK